MFFYRFFLSLILFFLFIFFCLPVKADWNKSSSNPVISQSVAGWDSLSVRSPSVIFDNNQFKLYYQGQSSGSDWQIGLAYSSDGTNWTKESSNPLLTASSTKYVTEYGLEEPTVLKDNLYRMWYKSDYWSVIRYAYSTDGFNWQKHEKYVLSASIDWENHGVANPCVIYKDGKYWMYYTAWGNWNGWLLGLATSTDGINWIKYENNPLNLPSLGHIGRPAVIILNNQFHLFYHTGSDRGTQIYHLISNDGINFNCDGTCAILHLGNSGSFDSNTIIGPAIIEHNSILYLYYGALGNNNIWQIGLATDQPLNLKKTPIVIIPGLFASWNKEALLHNQIVNQPDWILNPVVHEYDGITKTLTNLGYLPNQDYYFFYYDWRKDLNSLADDLNLFIQQLTINNPTIKSNLVGHSLGGLIGRIYLQKYNSSNINKIITVGSPHQGAAQTYKVVEAGEIDNENSLMWLAEKLILQINRDGLKTDKQTINEKLPIAKDLLPVYNFIKDQNNQEIAVSNMQVKNETLFSYQSTLPNIFSILTTIYGEKANTPWGYKVTNRSLFDQLFDLYPDGRPEATLTASGDEVVNSQSANIGNKNVKLTDFNHGEIIYKKDSIKKILESLSINYQDSQLVEGVATNLFPSLIFLIFSPATISVDYNGQIFNENAGLIFIDNAHSGIYQLNVNGSSLGQYTVMIGQLSNLSDSWTKLEGEIKSLPQIDSYSINFSNQNSQNPIISSQQLIDELIIYLNNTNKNLNKNDITKSIGYLQIAKDLLKNNNFGKLKSNFQLIHQSLFSAYSKNFLSDKPKILYAIEKLENIYGKSLADYRSGLFPSRLESDLKTKKKIIAPTQQFLLAQKNLGKNTLNNSLTILKIDEKLKLAETNLNQKNYLLVEILLKSVEQLLKEARKI